ncbi:hypothetical protein CYMTET_6902, partial [Cymbomonas tetramitiformis]
MAYGSRDGCLSPKNMNGISSIRGLLLVLVLFKTFDYSREALFMLTGYKSLNSTRLPDRKLAQTKNDTLQYPESASPDPSEIQDATEAEIIDSVETLLKHFSLPREVHIPCGPGAEAGQCRDNRRKYSSHRCLGPNARTRACLFRNVYFDIGLERMEYYHDPDTPKHVVMSTNHRDLYDFPGSNLEEKELLKGIEVEGFLHLEGGSERGLSSHEHGRWYRGSGNAEGGLMTLHK